MNIKRVPAALTIAVALAGVAAGAHAMEPFKADYQASAMGMQGNGQMSITAQGNNRWEYALSISNSLVDLSQKTVFDEQDGVLRPLSSSDLSRLLVKRKNVSAQFDWNGKRATWSGDVKPDRAGPVALRKGDMDALLVNLAIVRDVAAGKPLNYRLIENGKARPMSYRTAGKETITIGGKPHQATKVVGAAGDKEIIAWIVADMPVPARILQRENGQDSIDLQIKAWR